MAPTSARSAIFAWRHDGIKVGEPLRAFRGVLTGVPVVDTFGATVGGGQRKVTLSEREILERRILVLPPTRKDAELTESLLERAGIGCHCCTTLKQVCAELDPGAAAALLAEEPLAEQGKDELIALAGSAATLGRFAGTHPGSNRRGLCGRCPGDGPAGERYCVGTAHSGFVADQRPAYRAARCASGNTKAGMNWKNAGANLEAQAFLGAIVSSSDDAIISKTLDGVILTWNAGAERLFGYTADEAIGKPVTMLIPAERQDEEPKLLERLRRGERIEHFETVRVTKDGRYLDISLTVSPMRNADGKLIAASKVARDISERKRTEAALREANRHKDEFLATLAHELRNPLAPIRNSLHLLRMAAPATPRPTAFAK